jgi:L-ornithine Nalpha-acyltransferase
MTMAKAPMTDMRKVFSGLNPLPHALIAGADLMPGADDVVRDTRGLGLSLGRIGQLEVRLAVTRREIRRAQRLRYKVFYEEMSAVPATALRLTRRDKDAFDYVCDHLLVVDHDRMVGPIGRRRPKVVGTYRLLRQDVADAHFGFYTSSEFAIDALIDRHPGARFLELGRSCVLPPYRTKKTLDLLWHGIWTYVLHHRIDVMFGCASLEGTDPDRLGLELSFLHHHARTEGEWHARALRHRHVSMDRLSAEAVDPRKAIAALPPLIKGYLRIGAKIGEGAVVDRQFGTTDVLIVLPVVHIEPRYISHYGEDASRYGSHTAMDHTVGRR